MFDKLLGIRVSNKESDLNFDVKWVTFKYYQVWSENHAYSLFRISKNSFLLNIFYEH